MQSFFVSAGPGIVREGGWNYQTTPGAGVTAKPRPIQNDYARAWVDCAVRIRATCSMVQVYVYQHGQSLAFWIDGVPVSKTVLTNSNAWGWVTLATGLDSLNEHEYAVSICNSAGNGQYTSILQIQTDGTYNKTFAEERGAILGYGDSIVQGTTGTGGNSAASWLSRLAALKGYACINRGINGLLCETVGVNLGGADLAWSNGGECGGIYGEGISVKYVIVQIGHNDGNQSGFNAATFQASYSQLIQTFQAIYPNAKLLFLGYFPTTNSLTAQNNRTAANNAIAAAVAANLSLNTNYVNTDGWIDPTIHGPDHDTIDGCHPTGGSIAGQTGDGCGKIVTQVAALVS